MRANLLNLQTRELSQEKNLKGLLRYAKKLTHELEDFKEKVKMAEKIIKDLRESGNESIDALLQMLEGYKNKEEQSLEEIKNLKQLILVKDDEIRSLDEEILELADLKNTAKDQQERQLLELRTRISDNAQQIRRTDKLIVDLQQKNEMA